MYEDKYVKKGRTPNQGVDTQQEIGKDRFAPKGKGGVPGHASGKTSYPGSKRSVSISTQKHHANTRGPWAKGGGDKQVSFTAPKSRTKFGTEKRVGKDKFVPDEKPRYGVDGV